MKKIKSKIYRLLLHIKNFILQQFSSVPSVLTIEATIKQVKQQQLSICRFGDGEIDLLFGKDLNFQSYKPELAFQLRQATQSKKCLVCIPDIFSRTSFELITNKSKSFWKEHKLYYFAKYLKLFSKKNYGNAHISRFYIRYKDKAGARKTVRLLKSLWNDRDIIFIEGKESRLGVGNDLFSNSRSIKRIICPSKNAFDKYLDILNYALHLPSDSLFILALGPTATCLASELSNHGRQALDLGHIDLEYEYYIRKVQDVCFIDGKQCNEAALLSNQADDATRGDFDEEALICYKSEILKSF